MPRTRLAIMGALAALAVSVTASASASAFSFRWNIGGAEVPAGGDNVETVNKPETSTFKLESASGNTVTCTKVEGTGNVKQLGADEAVTTKFTGCTTGGGAGCEVNSPTEPAGTVVVSNTPTQLVERSSKLADEFKGEKGTEHEFATLDFTEGGTGGCSKPSPKYPASTKVVKQVAGECKNLAGGQVELNFPNPELAGNTLEAFGRAAKLVGKVKEKSPAGALTCI